MPLPAQFMRRATRFLRGVGNLVMLPVVAITVAVAVFKFLSDGSCISSD
jgi:hypothetical protein